MNILSAKNQIKKTVEMYLAKDEFGAYAVDEARQRPVFVIGAPGIGKTAIMKQIARELDVGFLSYTITHHTRQSAIGLPYIDKKTYGGKEYSVTEYTMSEIIAKVYEAIEKQGKKEGILFIDEINCVSETLAPSMLELLQNKKFGPHKIPAGWVLCAAGNPSEYNKSVREFDVATLDRVKKIEVEPDFATWQKYALEQGFERSVIYYLQIKPDRLFIMNKTPDGYSFVTPRGWEDLSVAIQEYGQLGFEVNTDLISQYVQDGETAFEFYRYYCLYEKHRKDYDVESILKGDFGDKTERFKNAKFDEKYAVCEVMASALSTLAKQVNVYTSAKKICDGFKGSKEELCAGINGKIENGNLDNDAVHANRIALKVQNDENFDLNGKLKSMVDGLHTGIDNVFAFLKESFGEGQEITAFMINLVSDVNFVTFIAEYGSEVFYENNELLLVDEHNKSLKTEIERILKKS